MVGAPDRHIGHDRSFAELYASYAIVDVGYARLEGRTDRRLEGHRFDQVVDGSIELSLTLLRAVHDVWEFVERGCCPLGHGGASAMGQHDLVGEAIRGPSQRRGD